MKTKSLQKFKYLFIVIPDNGKCDTESRIRLAKYAIQKLIKVLRDTEILLVTKKYARNAQIM